MSETPDRYRIADPTEIEDEWEVVYGPNESTGIMIDLSTAADGDYSYCVAVVHVDDAEHIAEALNDRHAKREARKHGET